MHRVAVAIGRFSGPHRQHIDSFLRRAYEGYDHVIVLMGSSFKARDPRDPFDHDLRTSMLRAAVIEAGMDDRRFTFVPIRNYRYSNNRWLYEVQKEVEDGIDWAEEKFRDRCEPILVGNNKDQTSFYLRMFPQWKSDVLEGVNDTTFNATDVRRALFEGDDAELARLCYPSTVRLMKDWLRTPDGQRIQGEYEFYRDNNLVLARWVHDEKLGIKILQQTPYAPVFYTTDAVIVWRGLVLLIERRAFPGKGLWALPGGFLDPKEWIKQGAVRERQEETKIYFYKDADRKVRLHLDEAWCRHSHEFDDPDRSLRGRTITRAFYWRIPDEYEVHIQAADDAKKAAWFPFQRVLSNDFGPSLFEDHQDIIAHMILGPHQ